MSNIYEALQQAQGEIKPEFPTGAAVDEGAKGPFPGLSRSSEKAGLAADAEMLNLHQNIDYLLPEPARKIIQFIGAGERDGVSTIVRRFAHTAINRLGKTVLIIDAAHHNPTQHLHFKLNCADGGNKELHNAYYPIGASLFLSPMSAQPLLIPQIHDRQATAGVFEQLREHFDLVLIDSAPGTTSPNSIAMSRFADGVIMVIEAEKTSRLMAESVKEKISRNGGNLMGIILNRRRYHIPEFIYRRL